MYQTQPMFRYDMIKICIEIFQIPQAGWLKCHPDKFSHDPYKQINIMGRNSFITAFGSIAHPLTLTGLAPFGGKRVCRSNAYSPENNVFKLESSG